MRHPPSRALYPMPLLLSLLPSCFAWRAYCICHLPLLNYVAHFQHCRPGDCGYAKKQGPDRLLATSMSESMCFQLHILQVATNLVAVPGKRYALTLQLMLKRSQKRTTGTSRSPQPLELIPAHRFFFPWSDRPAGVSQVVNHPLSPLLRHSTGREWYP